MLRFFFITFALLGAGGAWASPKTSVTMRSLWFQDGEWFPAQKTCAGYSYPVYPLSGSACGIRIVPISTDSKRCGVRRFASFQAEVTTIDPSTWDNPQRAHLYVGTRFQCAADLGLESLYVEAGLHAQSSRKYSDQLVGLYLRVDPNTWSPSALKRTSGAFGWKAGRAQPLSQKVFATGPGYLSGPDDSRGRFLVGPKDHSVGFSYRLIAVPVAGKKALYETRLQIIARGYSVDQGGLVQSEDSADKMEMRLVQIPAKSPQQALSGLMDRCKVEQRLVVGSDWAFDRKVHSGDQTQVFKLKNAAFFGLSGEKMQSPKLLVHYPLSPDWGDRSCMNVEMDQFRWTGPQP